MAFTFATISTSLLALSAFSHASPIPVPKQGFTILEKVPKRALTGPAHLARLYSKFSVEIPHDIVPALRYSNVIANPQGSDASYLCPVTIGGQTLNLDFDTGSADLWVFSTEQSSGGTGHTLYNPQDSATATILDGASWSITYADGSSAHGNVYLDNVTIDNVTVVNQAVEAAQSVSSSFQANTDIDGLLGLAFGSINTVSPKKQSTFFENAIDDGILPHNLFAVDLKAGQPGSYDFGFINSSKYIGDITYTPVQQSTGFWEIACTGLMAGNEAVGNQALASAPFNAIVDTGTTLLVLDDSLVSSYWDTVPGAGYDSSQGGYTFPCAAVLPDLGIGIESTIATVPGQYLNFANINPTTCFGGLQNNNGLGLSILGDVFIKSQFIVFDHDQMQVGVAAKDLGINPTPSTTSSTWWSTTPTPFSTGSYTFTPTESVTLCGNVARHRPFFHRFGSTACQQFGTSTVQPISGSSTTLSSSSSSITATAAATSSSSSSSSSSTADSAVTTTLSSSISTPVIVTPTIIGNSSTSQSLLNSESSEGPTIPTTTLTNSISPASQLIPAIPGLSALPTIPAIPGLPEIPGLAANSAAPSISTYTILAGASISQVSTHIGIPQLKPNFATSNVYPTNAATTSIIVSYGNLTLTVPIVVSSPGFPTLIAPANNSALTNIQTNSNAPSTITNASPINPVTSTFLTTHSIITTTTLTLMTIPISTGLSSLAQPVNGTSFATNQTIPAAPFSNSTGAAITLASSMSIPANTALDLPPYPTTLKMALSSTTRPSTPSVPSVLPPSGPFIPRLRY